MQDHTGGVLYLELKTNMTKEHAQTRDRYTVTAPNEHHTAGVRVETISYMFGVKRLR